MGSSKDLTKSRRLLLVEDDPDNLAVISMILGEKYHVLGCDSGTEALQSIQVFRPDALVLDIRMRPMNGLQCLQAIRSTAGFAGIPAVAVTACAREVEKQAFLAGGFQEVITKPILDHRILEKVIDRLLQSQPAARHDPSGDSGLTTCSVA